MDLFVGPLIEREGGYCYDTFSPDDGLRSSFRYRRVNEARYDQRAFIAEAAANPRWTLHVFDTLPEFEAAVAQARGDRGNLG